MITTTTPTTGATRILIVDDNPEIHADFRKVLGTGDPGGGDLAALEADLFGGGGAAATTATAPAFEIDSALQGKDALEMVRGAVTTGRPYTLAFVDVRMPPGWDGVETVRRIREVTAAMSFVICTAYSDYTPEQAREQTGIRDGMLFITKPFDVGLVRRLAESARRLAQPRAA
ncbi:MAG TPA: response regulator [Humisphaera sp.]